MCSPLRSPAAIRARLDAVDDLIRRADVMDDLKAALKKLPDLERLVRRSVMAPGLPDGPLDAGDGLDAHVVHEVLHRYITYVIHVLFR